MAITARVKSQYFRSDKRLIRLAPNQDHLVPTKRAGTPWTPEEHELFMEALEKYPSGPWKTIADFIGTRTTRQTMTHAQKYREKIARRRRTKEAASPTSDLDTNVQAVKGKYETRANESSSTTPPKIQTVNHATNHETELTDAHHQPVELQLDDSVITLLDAIEPLEKVEPWDPVTYSPTSVASASSYGIPSIDSLFQQCIPL